MEHFDDAIVGAGIIGLAHAYLLGRAGRKVVVFERGPSAQQASVRNFGRVWPIGQAAGAPIALARRSAELWTEMLKAAGFWHAPVGSLHLAYHADEATVLSEFVNSATESGFQEVTLLEPSEVLRMSECVVPGGLITAMYSPTEINVDPRQVIGKMPEFLEREFAVQFVWGTTVIGYEQPTIRTSDGIWSADNIYVCSGSDLQTLYPEVLGSLDFTPCKLQMMRATCPAPDWKLGPMLAAGLTLQHYKAFAHCPSLPALKARFAGERPEYNRRGIHTMISQNGDGDLTIGDSHTYGDDAWEPFDSEEINRLILSYLDSYFRFPGERQITARWNGIYMKRLSGAGTHVVEKPAPGATCVLASSGAGMTLAFGLAELTLRDSQSGD